MVLFTAGKPWLINVATIDDAVGDPDSLELGTRKKVQALNPRLRLELHSYFAEQLHQLRATEPQPGAEERLGRPAPMGFVNGQSATLPALLQTTLARHFSTSDLLDWAVFRLAEEGWSGAASESSWKRSKRLIVRYDLMLGAAVASLLAIGDGLNLKASGWIARGRADSVRAGWYVDARDVGLTWRPTFDVGGALATKGATLRIGAMEHPGSDPSAVGRAFQAKFTGFWQTTAPAGERREFTAAGSLKWIAESLDPRQLHDVVGAVTGYARLASGHRRPDRGWAAAGFAILLKGALETNFADRHALSGGITWEHETKRVQLTLAGRASRGFAPLQSIGGAADDFFVGLMFSGESGHSPASTGGPEVPSPTGAL